VTVSVVIGSVEGDIQCSVQTKMQWGVGEFSPILCWHPVWVSSGYSLPNLTSFTVT